MNTLSEVSDLLSLSRSQLDARYRDSWAGEIPRGDTIGTLLISSDPRLSILIGKLVKRLAWQGKVFDPEARMLRNKITAIGIQAIPAQVYEGKSLLDGRECIVIDYSATTLLARWVRDEIRQIAPGVYLGIAFVRGRKVVHFSLRSG